MRYYWYNRISFFLHRMMTDFPAASRQVVTILERCWDLVSILQVAWPKNCNTLWKIDRSSFTSCCCFLWISTESTGLLCFEKLRPSENDSESFLSQPFKLCYVCLTLRCTGLPKEEIDEPVDWNRVYTPFRSNRCGVVCTVPDTT